MSDTVSGRDLRTLVELLEDGRHDSPDVGLPAVVLEKLHQLIRCDQVSFIELCPNTKTVGCLQDYPVEAADPAPEGLDPEDDPFWIHFWQSAHCSHALTSGDVRTITMLSDFYSDRDWHNTGMYTDCLGPQGVEREAMLSLSAPPGRARRILWFRGEGPDFDSRDRMLMSLLRPHLNELYQDLERNRRLPERLTNRQRELLSLVARGHSNIEIARALAVSPATVRTHLENIFRQLGVSSRTAAIAQVFPNTPY